MLLIPSYLDCVIHNSSSITCIFATSIVDNSIIGTGIMNTGIGKLVLEVWLGA